MHLPDSPLLDPGDTSGRGRLLRRERCIGARCQCCPARLLPPTPPRPATRPPKRVPTELPAAKRSSTTIPHSLPAHDLPDNMLKMTLMECNTLGCNLMECNEVAPSRQTPPEMLLPHHPTTAGTPQLAATDGNNPHLVQGTQSSRLAPLPDATTVANTLPRATTSTSTSKDAELSPPTMPHPARLRPQPPAASARPRPSHPPQLNPFMMPPLRPRPSSGASPTMASPATSRQSRSAAPSSTTLHPPHPHLTPHPTARGAANTPPPARRQTARPRHKVAPVATAPDAGRRCPHQHCPFARSRIGAGFTRTHTAPTCVSPSFAAPAGSGHHAPLRVRLATSPPPEGLRPGQRCRPRPPGSGHQHTSHQHTRLRPPAHGSDNSLLGTTMNRMCDVGLLRESFVHSRYKYMVYECEFRK